MDSRYQKNICQIIHKYHQIVHKYTNLQIEEWRESKEEQTPESTSRLPATEKGQKAEDDGTPGRRCLHRGHPRWGHPSGTLHPRLHWGSGGGLPVGDVHVGATAAAWGGGKGATKERPPARPPEQRSGEGARADADTCKIQQPRI